MRRNESTITWKTIRIVIRKTLCSIWLVVKNIANQIYLSKVQP
jgi:hypothetical protein